LRFIHATSSLKEIPFAELIVYMYSSLFIIQCNIDLDAIAKQCPTRILFYYYISTMIYIFKKNLHNILKGKNAYQLESPLSTKRFKL